MDNITTSITIKWNYDDIVTQSIRDGITLTPKQVGKVLDNLKYYHDSEIGINWDVISHWITEVSNEN